MVGIKRPNDKGGIQSRFASQSRSARVLRIPLLEKGKPGKGDRKMRQVDWKRKHAGGRTVVKNGERGGPDGGWVERSFLLVGDQLWPRFFLALTSGLPLETSKHAHRTWLFFFVP